jgi:Uri superfamily endonuclease
MSGGTYSLVVSVEERLTVTVGALGARRFATGAYAYAGSARGPGGFARIERHREIARGNRDTRHWHLDYLLGAAPTSVIDAVRTPGVDTECAVAAATPGSAVPGFGASDCDCLTHLHGPLDRERMVAAVERAHADG